MYFRFGRVTRPAMAIGAFALVLNFVITTGAPAQSAGRSTVETPNWKDRQEYELFLKMSQTSDPKARLQLLNSWQDKYPQSDVEALRLRYYVATLAILCKQIPPNAKRCWTNAKSC